MNNYGGQQIENGGYEDGLEDIVVHNNSTGKYMKRLPPTSQNFDVNQNTKKQQTPEDFWKLLLSYAPHFQDQNVVEHWLKSINMLDYKKNFNEAGYDDLTVIAKMNVDHIEALQIKKPGHVLKLIIRISQLNGCMPVK